MPQKSIRRIEIVVLTALLLLGLIQSLLYQYYYVDDTFITLRYLDNLTDGHGLCFNPDERVEGYSCFAWIVLLAVPVAILKASGAGFPDPFLLARFLGIVAGLSTLFVLWRTSRVVLEPKNRLWSLVPPAWLVLSPPFWVWASSGMETPLFALLVTSALHRFIVESKDQAARPWSALLLALASLTRPEGPLYFAALLLYRLGRDRKSTSDGRLTPWLMLFAVPYGIYFIWRLAYFGQFFPTSVVAKSQTAHLDAAVQGIAYLGEFFRIHGGTILFLPALIPLMIRKSSAAARSTGAAWAIAAAGAALIIIAGGDWMFYSRFVTPFLPALIIPTVLGYKYLYQAVRGGSSEGNFLLARPGTAWILTAILILGSVFLSVLGFRGAGDDTMYDYGRTLSTWARHPHRLGPFLRTAWLTPAGALSFRLARNTTPLITWVGAANEVSGWIETNTPDDALLATTVAGYVPYRTGRPTVDMLGLNDLEIARLFRAGKYEELARMIFDREPEVVVLTILPGTAGSVPSRRLHFTDTVQEKFYEDPRFNKTYELRFRIGHYLVYTRDRGGQIP
jgi:hypothetical protein